MPYLGRGKAETAVAAGTAAQCSDDLAVMRSPAGTALALAAVNTAVTEADCY